MFSDFVSFATGNSPVLALHIQIFCCPGVIHCARFVEDRRSGPAFEEHNQNALKFHLELSLSISNSASVGVLSPEDSSANFLSEFGTALGMIL